MWLSHKPADLDHLYGHDRISFFSAGFEGALIVFAAVLIIFNAGEKLIYGFELSRLGEGTIFIIFVTMINGSLGIWLIHQGKRFHSIILEANGKHLITDCVTSCGVIVGLTAVQLTGLQWIDPAVACGTALNIIFTGSRLVKRCISGLMDQTDLSFDKELRTHLAKETKKKQLSFHHLRHRHTGARILIDFHLVFPEKSTLFQAHELTTQLEDSIHKKFGQNIDITTHLEPESAKLPCRQTIKDMI
jgi:cation diffusion facilitator family transporter